jgi:hypothetical protein
MIEDITKAVAAYRRLGTTEKRLFREEVGLKGPRDGVKRRRRAASKAATPSVPTTTRRRKSSQPAGPLGITETGDTVQ